MRRIVLPGVLLGLIACGLAPAQTPAPKVEVKPIVVPFEMLKSGHMAVSVKLNGKGPYKLIFDTGAPTTLLNNKVAKEANLLKRGKAAFTLFGSQGEVMVDTIEVGDQKAEKMSAIVMDHPTIDQISRVLGVQIEGLVGFPFFGRFKTTIDYQTRTMTFVPSGYDPPNVMEAMMAAMLGSSGPMILAPATTWGFNAEKGDVEVAGIKVTSVLPDSPAAKAGLKVGDRLLTLDGRWTDSMVDLYQAAGFVKPGAKVVLKVQRDGKEQKLEVTPVTGL